MDSAGKMFLFSIWQYLEDEYGGKSNTFGVLIKEKKVFFTQYVYI